MPIISFVGICIGIAYILFCISIKIPFIYSIIGFSIIFTFFEVINETIDSR